MFARLSPSGQSLHTHPVRLSMEFPTHRSQASAWEQSARRGEGKLAERVSYHPSVKTLRSSEDGAGIYSTRVCRQRVDSEWALTKIVKLKKRRLILLFPPTFSFTSFTIPHDENYDRKDEWLQEICLKPSAGEIKGAVPDCERTEGVTARSNHADQRTFICILIST